MNPVKKAVAYIVEKADSEAPDKRSELYRIAAQLTPDQQLADDLLQVASMIDEASRLQLRLKLQVNGDAV